MATPSDSSVLKDINAKEFMQCMSNCIALTSPLQGFLSQEPKMTKGIKCFTHTVDRQGEIVEQMFASPEDMVVHKDEYYQK